MGSTDKLLTLEQQDAEDREQRYVDAMLAARGVPERLHYAAGVLLDTADFEDEQTYHRAQLGRVLTALFGFGTLAGLRVSATVTAPAGDAAPASIEVQVAPGLALDRLGRLIEVRRKQCLKVEDWLASRDSVGETVEPQRTAEVRSAVVGVAGFKRLLLDVWLRYRPCAHGRTPAFAAGPFNATDYTVPSRLADGFEITFDIAADKTGAGDLPNSGLAAPDDKFSALQAIVDVAARAKARAEWSVDSVLDLAWVAPPKEAPDRLPLLAEQRSEALWASVLLARVEVPVTVIDQDGAPIFPRIAAKSRVDAVGELVDNRLRPVVFIPTAWRGQA
jgi:hypothetical protein